VKAVVELLLSVAMLGIEVIKMICFIYCVGFNINYSRIIFCFRKLYCIV